MGITTNLGIGDVLYADKQVMHLEADIEPLRADLGYTPQTMFDEGINETIKYYLSAKTPP